MTEVKSTALKDYRATDYVVDAVHLHFDLFADKTLVRSIIDMRRNPDLEDFTATVVFDGEDLELLSVAIDGKVLSDSEYKQAEHNLIIENAPEKFRLEIEVQIDPHNNTKLSGLYVSGGNYCTQCEAEGFRRITYFYDRPDVMTKFTII